MNSLTTTTRLQEVPVPTIGAEFQAYRAMRIPSKATHLVLHSSHNIFRMECKNLQIIYTIIGSWFSSERVQTLMFNSLTVSAKMFRNALALSSAIMLQKPKCSFFHNRNREIGQFALQCPLLFGVFTDIWNLYTRFDEKFIEMLYRVQPR